MDDAGPASIILKLFLLFILILINAFFAMSEIAIISLNDAKMEKMAEDGDKKAKQVLKLTKNSSNFLSTIQIGVTLAGFLTSAVAAQNFAVMLTDALAKTSVVKVIPVGAISVILFDQNPHIYFRSIVDKAITPCLVFFPRVDVWIIPKCDRLYSLVSQRVYAGKRARRTAAVKKHIIHRLCHRFYAYPFPRTFHQSFFRCRAVPPAKIRP